MISKFKITIPKPCHENWHTMTPKEKGRFCGSCSKTVVDFTKKTTTEIQDYLTENRNQKTCGHFYKKQLDAITIEIPQITFKQQLSFQKLFVLALLFVMGTTLFSCQYSDGKKQKIENVVLVDTLKMVEEKIDSVKNIESSTEKPMTFACESPIKESNIIEITTVGELPIEEEIIIDGTISYEEIDEDTDIGFITIEESPRFKQSKKLSKREAKKDFELRMKKFIQNNLDNIITQGLDLHAGKHRIYFQFVIDKKGNITDIKVRAPHSKLKDEVTKMLQKLPQFIPGKHNGKVVKTKYNLPISFVVE